MKLPQWILNWKLRASSRLAVLVHLAAQFVSSLEFSSLMNYLRNYNCSPLHLNKGPLTLTSMVSQPSSLMSWQQFVKCLCLNLAPTLFEVCSLVSSSLVSSLAYVIKITYRLKFVKLNNKNLEQLIFITTGDSFQIMIRFHI